MRAAALIVTLLVACGGSGDATPDAPAAVDSAPAAAQLALVEVPAAGQPIPIDEQAHYEVRVKNEGDENTGLLSFNLTGSSDFTIET